MATRTAVGSFDDGARNLIKIATAIASVVAGIKAVIWIIDSLTD